MINFFLIKDTAMVSAYGRIGLAVANIFYHPLVAICKLVSKYQLQLNSRKAIQIKINSLIV